MTSSALETGGLVAKGAPFPRSAVGLALLLPALVFLIVFLVLPSLILLGYSVLTQSQAGDISLPLTFASYERLIFSAAYRRVVAPLVVSVIVRTYGWQLLLGNSATGGLNWVLHALGAGSTPVQVMYSEWAVVIASVHVFLPLMVLPLSASLGRINPSLNEAARMLG